MIECSTGVTLGITTLPVDLMELKTGDYFVIVVYRKILPDTLRPICSTPQKKGYLA